nr:uncharacterized protein LOC117274910 [Nicotiana tomentosiformis]
MVSLSEYIEFLQYKTCKQTSSEIVTAIQTDNSVTCVSQSSSASNWVIDPGASDHISGNKSTFTTISYSQSLPTVTIANESQTVAIGIGQESPLPSLPLNSVLYVSDSHFNLIVEHSTGRIIDTRSESNRLYYLILVKSHEPTSTACSVTDSPDLLYKRFGHPSLSKLQKMVLASGPADSHPIPDPAPTTNLSPPSQPITLQKVKGCLDGQVDRLKARLVAKGYTKIFELDYNDIFSPVSKLELVCLFLSMVVVRHCPLYKLDIKSIFLHGDLEDGVYMEQPPDFVAHRESSGFICRLSCTFIEEFGITHSEADHSVFYNHSASNICIYLVVCVGDIVTTGNDQDALDKGLLFEDRGHEQIVGYSDVDWAG